MRLLYTMACAIRVCGAFFGALLDFGHQQNQPLALGGTTNWATIVWSSYAKKKKPAVHSINCTGCLIGILTEPQEICWGFPSPSLSNQLQSMFTVVTSIKIESRCFFTKCMTSIHPGRLTAGTYSHHPKRKENYLKQTSRIMFQPFGVYMLWTHANDEPTFCEFHEGWSSDFPWCLPCPKLPALLSDGLQCFFLVLTVLPLNAHGRIFQHWKRLNFQVKQNHCNMPFRFNQTYVPTCQKAKHFQYPCRLGGWWTWLHFRNRYCTSDIKVFCSNIQFTSTLLALHNAKRFW